MSTTLSLTTSGSALEQFYETVRASGKPIITGALEALEVSTRISDTDVERIPRSGGCVVVANHPTGMLDGLVAAAVLQRVRRDVKILANHLLAAVPELESSIIPVDLVSDPNRAARTNVAAMRRAIEHVAGGGMLLVFPAGEVSRFQWSSWSAADRGWNAGVVRLIRAAARLAPRVVVLPMHLSGANTIAFHLAGAVHPRIRLVMLPRELLNKRGVQVEARVGHPITAAKLGHVGDDAEAAEYLRWRTYLLARRPTLKARTNVPLARTKRAAAMPVIEPVAAETLRDEISALPRDRKLAEADGLVAYIAGADEIPNVLTEIGRLREITFRAAGEGTGLAADRDRFDDVYQHLFLWNESKGEIAGAYRVARTGSTRALYTRTLFSYGDSFLRQMGPAIELGRSFVRLEYQRGFAPLLLLWKGIGQYVARHPECKVLFGPVSISNQYQTVSRELMVAYLERRAPLTEWLGMVSSRMPFRPRVRFPARACEGLEVDDVSAVISDIEPDGRGVPVLLRQYLKLGGRLLGFNVDPDFSNALDGLIVVDLTRTEPKLLERYLGKAESAAFLAFHNNHRNEEAYAA